MWQGKLGALGWMERSIKKGPQIFAISFIFGNRMKRMKQKHNYVLFFFFTKRLAFKTFFEQNQSRPSIFMFTSKSNFNLNKIYMYTYFVANIFSILFINFMKQDNFLFFYYFSARSKHQIIEVILLRFFNLRSRKPFKLL